MGFDDKAQIVKSGDDLFKLIDQQTDNLLLLRAYNGWYTTALEFVKRQAKNRLPEFENLHNKNQSFLCQLKPDLQQVKVNLTIQIAIIEGSTDHDVHISIL